MLCPLAVLHPSRGARAWTAIGLYQKLTTIRRDAPQLQTAGLTQLQGRDLAEKIK